MKLKLDENGHVVVLDGKPVYVHEDGKEIPFDAPGAMGKINALNSEAKDYRLKAKGAEKVMAALHGVDDPAEWIARAQKAVETVANLDAKKLVDAGEIERMKQEIAKSYETKTSELQKQLDAATGELYSERVSGRFARSKFISEKLIVPSDMVEALFGKNFKLEDGQVVAYLDGQKLYSRVKPGELAGADEAIEMMVERYPHKDTILRGSGGAGSGAHGGGEYQGGKKTIKSGDMEAFGANLEGIAKGDVVVS